MIVKVVLVVSLLKICAGSDPSSPQRHSNHAVSYQSFVRHDVPLAYKYSSVHVYSTPKPDGNKQKAFPDHHHVQSQPAKEIQYAPIYHTQTNQNNEYNKLPSRNEPEIVPENQNVAKSHLEPKPQELVNVDNQQVHLSYVPGYNVELLQAVNRYPGHNAVYRSYPNMSPHDKINKVNFLNQYTLNQKPVEEYGTSQPDVSQSTAKLPEQTKTTLSTFVPKQNKPVGQRPRIYNTAHIATLKALPSVQALLNLQEMVPHPKAHKMLLNIARTYNIAGNSQKAHASLTMLKNVPSHTQAIIHLPNTADIDRNTRLLPIPSKQIRQHSHRLS